MTVYSLDLDDEEWREVNFAEDVRHSAAQLGVIATADKLIEYAKKNGPDGILESAIMLGQFQYQKVERALKKLPKVRPNGHGRKRR